MAGTTRACRRSPVCAGAGSRRPASVCSVNASAYRKPTRGSISAYLNRRCAMIRAARAAPDGGARSHQTGHRQLSGRRHRMVPRAHSSARGGGLRAFPFSRELWIEREDFCEHPPKGYFRLFPGHRVRLRYGFVVECTGVEKDAQGAIIAVHGQYFPDSQSGAEGANAYKVKGNIHWVSRVHAVAAEVRLYDRLFSIAQPDTAEGNFSGALNPESRRIVRAWLEPGAQAPATEERVQFERQGYFVTDCIDSTPQRLVFNRIARLKDRWSKAK